MILSAGTRIQNEFDIEDCRALTRWGSMAQTAWGEALRSRLEGERPMHAAEDLSLFRKETFCLYFVAFVFAISRPSKVRIHC